MSTLSDRIHATLSDIGPAVIACSGGIDSTLLALVAHRLARTSVIVAHATSPAVPLDATARVKAIAATEGWDLRIVQSGEFDDENYLGNPVNRCYFCKSHLYDSLASIGAGLKAQGTVLSGANLDDLGEYRPGLTAASERGVRHPWIEAGFPKAEIRALARALGQDFAELAASPCLASRLYTGTRVTAGRLAAVEAAEALIRNWTGITVVRCRIRDNQMLVETSAADRAQIEPDLIEALTQLVPKLEPGINTVLLDEEAYRPGRAFTGAR